MGFDQGGSGSRGRDDGNLHLPLLAPPLSRGLDGSLPWVFRSCAPPAGFIHWCHPLPGAVPWIAPAKGTHPSLEADLSPFDPMLRIRGDRSSLLAALAAHWADQQLQLPLLGPGTALSPAPQPRRPDRGPAR